MTGPNPRALFGQAMNAGDAIRIRFFVTSPGQGRNVSVAGVTTGQSGTIVLSCKYGPLLPGFGAHRVGSAPGWGLVDDTPSSFVRETGHTSGFSAPAARFCAAGPAGCDSHDTARWLGFTPLKITSVTFADGSAAEQRAAVSDLGGTAEVSQACTSYGSPFCAYPWYASSGTGSAFTSGADYPGTAFDSGQGAQFATPPLCGGPSGPDSTFCDTVLRPAPHPAPARSGHHRRARQCLSTCTASASSPRQARSPWPPPWARPPPGLGPA